MEEITTSLIADKKYKMKLKTDENMNKCPQIIYNVKYDAIMCYYVYRKIYIIS